MAALRHAQAGSGDRVVLIGAGSTNALTAVRLLERGFHVTVLEKAAIGNGSSSRSSACIRAQFGIAETVVGMQYAEWWYAHFHEALHTAEEHRALVVRRNGYLFLYEDPLQAGPRWRPDLRRAAQQAWQRARENVAMQREIGLPVDTLEPREVSERWPHIEAERLIGATWCPEDGFLTAHLIYGEGFRRAQELGADVLQGTEVIGAQLRGGRIVRLETTRGPIEADWFVNGTNAWAPRVSRAIGGMPLPIAPLKRYLYFLKPSRPLMSAAAWEALPMTIYGLGPGRGAHTRPEGSQLLIGMGHDAEPEPDFEDADQDRVEPAFHHAHGVDNYGCDVLEQIATFAPQLAECGGIAATTCGFYGTTPDANPLIGFDANHANLVHAAGFSGHGLMHAPITAVLVEALLAGDARAGRVRLPPPFEHHSIDLAAFAPDRDFSRSRGETMVL